ncbi:hypothetical protein [Actinomyces ruminis]|uniref:Lipoprotein n=1 Tax=Actinomyces ruminis TaxID=1937003 RepID=A0ABX4M882_9ACTO|nr:hypothetical protein [Actinomyces ruminis]PHP51295.1 hypothetical protein BW737_015335 [Actinomyces ruminis]
MALLLACAPLVACSSGSDESGLDIPTYDPEAWASAEASESAAAAAASASAAASAEAAGVVTAESLSTDRYVVTSIPEDLDEQQTEVLKAFVNYEQVTWNIWFTGTGVENAQAVATGDALAAINANYKDLNGEHNDGFIQAAVSSVTVTTASTSLDQRAEVVVCGDQSGLLLLDASGKDIGDPTLNSRYELRVYMALEGNSWKAYGDELVSVDECVAY